MIEVITIRIIIDEIIPDQITDKMPNGLLGTEVRVEIGMMTILEVEVEMETIFASECPNTPTDEETDYEDVDPASLQMMIQNYGPAD